MIDSSLPADASAREREIAERASALAAQLAPAEAEHDRTSHFPLEHYRVLHEAGYLRLGIPRAYGGEGASMFELVIAQERLSHAGAALGVGAGMLFNVIGKLTAFPEALAAYVLTTIARKGGLANMVVTEPKLGSISRGGVPETTAIAAHGGYLINGRKIFVTAAPALRFLITAVRLPPDAANAHGYTALAVIEAPAAGLTIESTWRDALSQRSGGSDDVILRDVFVPASSIVEKRPIGEANAALSGPGDHWLPLVAVYLGVGQAALEQAITYAHGRAPSVLAKPLAEAPQIQQRIGEIAVTLAAARALLYDTARRFDRHPELHATFAPHVATAKYSVTHAVCHATDVALRVAGGFSLTRELTLERHFRDARAGLFQPLQDDLALALVGRSLLSRADA